MSLSDLASLGSFVSGAAVLVSLIFLYFQLGQLRQQIRQAEKNQRALMQQGRADRVVDLQMRLAEPSLAAVYVRGIWGEDLSALELAQFGRMVRATMFSIEDTYFQHQDRLLADQAFESVTSSMRASLATPGLRAMWKLQRNRFEPGFRAYIDAIIRGTPLARPADALAEWKAAVAAELSSGV